jgi:hypothetical protein
LQRYYRFLTFYCLIWITSLIKFRFAALAACFATRASSTAVRFIVPAAMCLATFVSPFTTSCARADILSGPVTNPSNGNHYYLLTQNNWSNSEAEAVGLGGHLVTINDATENSWVTSTLANFAGVPRALWIGLNDVEVEGSFVWASGEPVSFTNWGPAFGEFPPEPNNHVGIEDWAHVFPPTDNRYPTWNDAPDLANFGFDLYGVVEVPVVPEPDAAAHIVGGLIAATLGQRGKRGRKRAARRRSFFLPGRLSTAPPS